MKNIVNYLNVRLSNLYNLSCKDVYENNINISGELFKKEDILIAIEMGIKEISMFFKHGSGDVDNSFIINNYSSLIAQHALITLLSGKALIEKGREYTFNDNGIEITLPAISDILMEQYKEERASYEMKLNMLFARL